MTVDASRTPGSRTRPVAWWLLVPLEVLIAVNALYGGIDLMVNGMGMPPNWLDATPFDSWMLPCVLLLVSVAVPMSIAAVRELTRWRLAYVASVIAGLAWLAHRRPSSSERRGRGI